MGTALTGKKIAKNIGVSMLAQFSALVTSFVLTLIGPKFIPKADYALWQTYALYINYIGILHFGLLDGLMFRYAQYDYGEIDRPRVRSQLHGLLAITTACAALTFLFGMIFGSNREWRVVIAAIALAMILKNVDSYSSYTFQMTNRINRYATVVMVNRVCYLIFFVICIACGADSFYWYIGAELASTAVSLVLGMCMNKGLYFGKGLPFAEGNKEIGRSLAVGFVLMLANFSGLLIVGIAKVIVQAAWGEELFAELTFAFSASGIALAIASAVSVVLFPSLKRIESERLPKLYLKIRNAVSPLLFITLLLYFPGAWLLKLWLPNYTYGIEWLGVLFPICVYSTKVNLLTNNYFKAYRKEKLMLAINFAVVAVGCGMFLLCAYAFRNVIALLVSVVCVVMIQSVVSEISVARIIGIKLWKYLIAELIMTVIFIVAARLLPNWWACLTYACALALYCVVYWGNLVSLFRRICGVLHRRREAGTDEATQSIAAESQSEELPVSASETERKDREEECTAVETASSDENREKCV